MCISGTNLTSRTTNGVTHITNTAATITSRATLISVVAEIQWFLKFKILLRKVEACHSVLACRKGQICLFFTSGTFKIHSRSQGPASPAAQLKPQDGWVCKKWKKVSTTGNGLEIVSSWGIFKACRAFALLARQHNYSLKMDGSAESE